MRNVDVQVMMEFFRARLHEDEAAARAPKPGKDKSTERLQARVLADVAAKRRLMRWVEDHMWKARLPDSKELPWWKGLLVEAAVSLPQHLRSPAIRTLVAAYADHPDFRPEWLAVDDEREGDEESKPGVHESRSRRQSSTA
ncbi:DUF6221 family protein [Streptomyces uncialis]|uniref:DUF6221 family protein n=1 Tax=Streptomyces uncialis TaxID=1048205 RepID=UPI00364C8B2B